MFTQVFWGGGGLRERDHLEDAGLDGRIILKWIFRKWEEGAWTGLIWLSIGTGVGFHKRQGISLLNENRFASKEGLCCMG